MRLVIFLYKFFINTCITNNFDTEINGIRKKKIKDLNVKQRKQLLRDLLK